MRASGTSAFEDRRRRGDTLVRYQQLDTIGTTFKFHTGTHDDRWHPGSIQGDPCQIGVKP